MVLRCTRHFGDGSFSTDSARPHHVGYALNNDQTDYVRMVEKCHKLTFVMQIGGNALAACFIIDLPELGVPVRTLVSFEGH